MGEVSVPEPVAGVMRRWLESTARAIDGDPALRPYAILLSLVHALTGVAWFTYKNIAELASGDDCVCWPLLPECYRLRPHLTPALVRDATLGYIAVGLVAATLFALHRARPALVTFLVATVAGTLLYSLDYRLRFNQTYMFGWVVLAFVLAPAARKAVALQALVALFYFWAGTLKLNAEWVTGAALYAKPFLVPEALVPASCIYVLVLEMGLVWGLFARSPRWRFAVYAQLLLFHAVSWTVVGYDYPLVMFALTAIYPLVWLRVPDEMLTIAALADASTRRSVLTVATIFSAFQLVPHLFPGDTAVTGEGRLFALHMFDARTQCEGGAIVTRASGRSRALLINEQQDTRSHCDPIVLLGEAQRLCRLLAARGDPARVDVAIDAKRTTDPVMRPLLRMDDLCHQEIAYSVWGHNAWISPRISPP